MPIPSWNLLGVLALLVCGLWPTPANACSCARPGQPCEAAWRADAVFVGHVVSIESSPTQTTRFGGRRVELAVVEPFRGLQLSQVTVVTGYSGADCGYPFQLGESYIVYAHRSPEGELFTSICTRTRLVRDANEDLAYARSMATIAPSTRARLAGRVHLWEWPAPGGQLKPVPRVAVTATSAGRIFSARTNDRGEFELTGLPLGKFDLIARAPVGFDAIAGTVEIHDPRGCGTMVLYIRYDARVIGRIVDAAGAGVGGLAVELVPKSDVDKPDGASNRVQAWTETDGTFELRLVAPGQYLVGFNLIRRLNARIAVPRAFYPGVTESGGAATVTVSAAGERVRLNNFVVPETIKLVTVNGIVVDEAGRPVREAVVILRVNAEGAGVIGPRFVTGEDGRFAFAVVEGGKYDVHVTRYLGNDVRTREAQISMVPFTASAATPTVTVVMKPSRY